MQDTLIAIAYVCFFLGCTLYLVTNASWFIIVFSTPALILAAYYFALFLKDIVDQMESLL